MPPKSPKVNKGKENVAGKKQDSKKYEHPISKTVYIVALLGGVGTYFVLNLLQSQPPMPEVNLNEYWGSYPMPDNPDISVKPYKIEFSDVIVNDLKERLLHRRPLPEPLENAGFTYGFNSNFLSQVADYWANKYNFKERERFLNQYNHFTTKIQGLNIHFIHVKPPKDQNVEYEVVPILMMHGWPGSVREFYEIIPKLMKPREGKTFIFEMIIPSLPGFGFSEAATRPGFGPMEMAVLMRNLMERLGFRQYYIQGGDLGHTVGSIMATLFPDNVLGFHTNFPAVVFNPVASLIHFLGSFLPPNWVDNAETSSRLYPYSDFIARTLEESGYMHIQATKPDTIGTALSDSPSGLAAYILEKFSTWTNPDYKKAYDGKLLEKYSLTNLLDNVMIYWATNSITTSVRTYAETFNSRSLSMIFDRIHTSVPTWGIKFKYELVYQTDFMLKLKYKNYLRTTVVDDGGHFAAFENPDLLATDIFEAVHTFRQFHGQNKYVSPKDYLLPKTVYRFTVNDIYGNPTSLETYRGYVLLIVNVASQCGLTETNYKELNILHNKYYNKGLRILAFPCNQFNGQEPGSAADIVKFIKEKGVEFDVFEKVDVNGEEAVPLWQFLKKTRGGTLGDFIKWNFSKFIVDRNGFPVERLGPTVSPLELEPYLAKYL